MLRSPIGGVASSLTGVQVYSLQSNEFVECAAYWYAKLLDGVTVCEGILGEEGNNSEEWVDPDEKWSSPAYY